ncbi:MAG TPA: DUF424 family protein [archaeon]|nr:DUF424 family protein [archaeon]HLD80417.1 DUF424 family protein [archaeon]
MKGRSVKKKKLARKEASFYLRLHKTAQGPLLACCDSELLGKVLESSENSSESFPFFVSPRFYGGELRKLPELHASIASCAQANVIGENAVKFLVENRLATRKSVIMIGRVPHVVLIKV